MEFIKQINDYVAESEQDKNDKKVILDYINDYKDNILTRENEIAHMTSSGFILNKTCDKVLMIHHNIYNTWTWTGGHADGEEDLLITALKEAIEETGVHKIKPLNNEVSSIDILPVWGHMKNGAYVSAHLHLNTSFILIADENAELLLNEEETSGVAWISIDDMPQKSNEPFLLEIYFKLINRAKKELYIA
ncbi:MAG: NUDIX hydrolase [Acidaminobacteraceae bacterium]